MKRNTKISKLTMLEEFEVQGYWWLPEDRENELSGNLYSEEGDFYLEILGSFSTRFSNISEYDYIHGFTVKGEKVTLIRGMGLNNTLNAPGISTEKLLISSFIIGEHLSEVSQVKFQSVNIVMTHLTNWFNSRPFNAGTKTEEQSDNILNDTISFIPPKVNTFYLKSLDAKIRNHYSYTRKGDFIGDASYSFIESFRITTVERKSYDWFNRIINSVTRLMTLLINEPIYIKKIVFYGEYENIPGTYRKVRKKHFLYFSQRDVEVKEKFHFFKMLFTFHDIQTNFEKVFDTWFEKETRLRNVYNLYFSDFFNRKEDLETKFLNAVQTLEVYHRSMGYGKIFTDEEKDNYLLTIGEAIEDLVPENIYKEVNNKLQYFNEYSLSKRLKDIIDHLNKDTRVYLLESNRMTKSFIYKVVSTRNYLTHYGEGLEKKVYKGIELYYATIILKTLAGILLFKELSIDEEKVLIAIKENSNLSSQIHSSKSNLKLI